ncbi:SAM-dependent methyltransferase [Amycolatopsis panacis]|uniref:SAM-dependent methyltransferase n=1 Tax=Amycolatopsis panacis TaxID=2340917 RepID=UPI001F39BEB3|nr:SAM-dependent methyltransferase [Amycolatopsis panacis]
MGSGDPHISAAHAAIAAARTQPAPRIVLIDHDVIVRARAELDMENQPPDWHRSTFVEGNVFATGWMLASLAKRGLLDLDQRVCVLAVDILHFGEPDINVRSVPRRLARRLAPGSLIAATHLADQPLRPPADTGVLEDLRADTARWRRAHHRCAPPHHLLRSPADFASLLADLDLLHPGITTPGCWPEPDNTANPRAPYTLAAVGRVPEHSGHAKAHNARPQARQRTR